ncbi:hypothetical protein [Curvibacter lanceolatus]|uniref:hypothetical protein n=1 Tax=Curvibacter lanceolatus TaxID=86182 RepID=UPI000368EC24|nr:hypothetical protein [Curvibacter lanceolatus]
MAGMKKRTHGPSLYYASDKNVFDALNQHKVDTPTVVRLFQRRNVVVSKKTPRDELAKYFSTLTHDYYDHKEIAARLGVAVRRERTTSMDVSGVGDTEELHGVVEQLKKEMEASGDTVQVTRDGDNFTIRVQYSEVDYKRSEFSQVQVRDGTIEFVKSDVGYVVRNTQNDYLNGVRETLLAKVEKTTSEPLTKVVVALFDIPSAKLRSKFFHELASSLPNFVRRDVTDVYVFKAKPDAEDDEDEAGGDENGSETHVERVFLRGSGVSRSEILNELLDEEDYYIIKMGWTATELLGEGNVYDIEAGFADPKDCTGFSFILSGVYPLEEGKVSARRRPPHKHEIDALSRVIESKARDLVAKLRSEFLAAEAGSE